MRPTFRLLAIIAGAGFFALAVAWMFFPQTVLSVWQVSSSAPTLLVSRRAAALYAGIAVMLLGSRNSPPSAARSAISLGFAVACSFLALLGLFELSSGHAGRGILGAVVLEALMAGAFLAVRNDI